MKKFLSKYHFRYIRSLVYIFQASEYNLSDALSWYKKVDDWRNVEKRKNLVFTTKAKMIYFGMWIFAGIYILGALNYLAFSDKVFEWFVVAVSFFLVGPILIAIFGTFLVVSINFAQKPIEKRIIDNARKKLAKHKAIKIAVAGSFGKTTMKETLSTVLSKKFRVASTPDNKNTPLGISRFINTLKFDEEMLIFELGEYYKGDIMELCHLTTPDIGIITGVNEAHLSKFEHTENTLDTIFELAKFIEKQKKSRIYVNAESFLAKERAHVYNSILYLYGKAGILSSEGNMEVFGAETDLFGVRFVLKGKDKSVVVSSSLLGLHQVGPLSAIVHIALSLGMKVEDIETGIKETKAFEHRLEPKEMDGGVLVIDDSYNGNPDGVRAAIDFLKDIKNKRRFYVTPGLVEMGKETERIHLEMGRNISHAGIEKVVLIRNSITPYIEEGLKSAGYKGDIIWFDNPQDCFANLPRQTISNDLILYQNDWPDNYS